MNIKQKFLISLNLLIITCFSHALPENAPQIGSLMVGAITSVIAVGNQNPLLLVPALCATAGMYKYLQRYTPTYRLNLAKDMLEEMSQDPLVKTQHYIYENALYDSEYSPGKAGIKKNQFLQIINTEVRYQKNLKENGYPLLTARDTLIDFESQLKSVKVLIDNAKHDLKDEDIQSGSLYFNLDEQHTLYSKNIASAVGCIIACNPEYQQALEYENSKSNLALQKENNQIQQSIAQAKQQKASANTRQAEAARSYTRLAWLKYIIYFLTGWGKPA